MRLVPTLLILTNVYCIANTEKSKSGTTASAGGLDIRAGLLYDTKIP